MDAKRISARETHLRRVQTDISKASIVGAYKKRVSEQRAAHTETYKKEIPFDYTRLFEHSPDSSRPVYSKFNIKKSVRATLERAVMKGLLTHQSH